MESKKRIDGVRFNRVDSIAVAGVVIRSSIVALKNVFGQITAANYSSFQDLNFV